MKKALQVINEMERHGIIGKYAIGGAMGATFYVEPFTTFDLDVFVVLPHADDAILLTLTPVYEYLAAQGYLPEKECVMIEGVPVQFLPAYNPLLEEALAQARDILYDDVSTRVLTLEHLTAIAVQTGRGKDRARLPMFMESEALDHRRLDEILARYGLTERWSQWTSQ
jgi:hypothetical protein